jgi:signal transduction histidine kinase
VTQEQEEQDRLEQHVAERTQELSLLLDVSRNVASTLELQPLLGLILDEVRAAAEYQGAGILTFEDEVLVQVAQRGPALDDLDADLRLAIADADVIRDAVLGTEPLVIPDVWAESPPARAYRQAVTEEWLRARPYIRSWVGAPLRVRERPLGLLVITYGEANHFTDHHVRLLKAVAAQASVAIENARLMAGAREAAALEERQRLARELHDAVTQTLFSASLIGDVLPTLWARDPERAEQALQDLRVLTRGALAEMRTLLFELRPNALIEVPLGDLLRHLGDATTGHSRVPVTVTVKTAQIFPPDVQVALYRIAQEALNNVVKYAEATQVELRLSEGPGDSLELAVTDNGRGFDLAQTSGGHFGLQTMRERARMIGANLTVTTAPGRGTGIVVTWPAADHGDAEEG